jgi:hypothetical protein
VALGRHVEARRDDLAVPDLHHLADLLRPLVDQQHEEHASGWFSATPSTIACSSIVLPERAGATISARCPKPIGAIRSTTRRVSSGPVLAGLPVSSFSLRSG